MSKLFCFDTETTGLDTRKCAIHQLSGKIIINDEVKEIFNFKIRPHEGAIINDESLEISGVTREQIMAYPSPVEFYQALIKMLSKYVDKFNKRDKFHLAGFNNCKFDNELLRALFERMEDKYFGSWFWSDSIDAMVLASLFLEDKRALMPDFKLMTVAKFCGIPVDESKLHDAQYDIEITYRVIKGIKTYMNMGIKAWNVKIEQKKQAKQQSQLDL